MTLSKLVKLSTGYAHAFKVGQVLPFIKCLEGGQYATGGGWVYI